MFAMIVAGGLLGNQHFFVTPTAPARNEDTPCLDKRSIVLSFRGKVNDVGEYNKDAILLTQFTEINERFSS